MQGRDKMDRKKSPQDELLEEAFNACMEEQLSFIPPEREIARMHTFSESFLQAMEVLLRTKGRPERRQITKREFIYSFNRIAACILAVLVVGGACVGGWIFLERSTGYGSSAPNAETTEEAAAADISAWEEEEAEAEEPAEAAEPSAGIPQEADNGSYPEEVEFMGNKIHLAASQTLPEKAGNIKTLVNSPVIARDAGNIKVTIGNMTEHPIYYYASMDLEVRIDGAWYLVPSTQELTEEEMSRMVMLEPGMAQDEEMDLTYYDLDYDAEQYRVVTYLDGLILSSEFRFENPEEDLEEALE